MIPMKRAVSLIGVLLGLAMGTVVGCSPTPAATICYDMSAHTNLFDDLGNGVQHLGMNTVHCIDPYGTIVRSSSEQLQASYGYLGLFSGADLIATPQGVALVNGAYTGNLGQYDSAHWTMKLGFTIYGYGYYVSKGNCWLNAPVWRTSGGGHADSNVWYALGSAYGICDNFGSARPFATTGASDAAYARLSGAQRAVVDRDKAAVLAYRLPTARRAAG